MKQKLLLKSMLLLCALIAGSSSVWAAEGDKHDFSQSLSQLLNNNASISSINIAKQSYTVKEVIVSYRYNNTKTDAVTMEVSVGGNSWGTFNVNGTGSNYSTKSFTDDAVKGAITISFTNNTGSGTGHGTFYVNNVQLVEGPAAVVAGTTAAPSISGNTPFFGTTTVTISNAASADGADRFYTLNGDAPTTTASATCFAYSDPFTLDATATVKAIAKKSTDTNASTVVSKTFTKVTPTTVAAALTAINSLADNGTIAEQSVRGIVTEVGSYSSNTITYTISDDVAGSNSLKVYKGKGLHNANFAAASDVKVGDDVVIYGTLKKYKSGSTITPEFLDDNYLLYQEHKTAPTFTLDRSNATLSMGNTETVDVKLTTNTDGAITCESTNTNVATVALKSAGVYTITAVAAGSATIKIKSALTDNYQPAQANVSVTVNDNREAAGLAFTNASVTKTWGEEFTGQALTNPHSLPVTWSSTNETVATVDNTGAVTVLKAGSTTIKATFDGDATYKKSIVSYTLTINKAPAGLSYTTTEFDIMLNDDSFVAPTLNNPNSLTVTYASNNPAVAVVDENTGELVYDDTAAGTAKITATFAGNDNYYDGSANYTINIIDPSVKGTKYNPYTVAEVRAVSTSTTISNVYVEGYIIGFANSTYGFTTTASDFADTNWVIADSKDENDVDKTTPVQIASANQSNYGLAVHPELAGAKVLIKGNITKYFNVSGVKNLTEITIESVSVPVSAYKWGTFVCNQVLDFDGTDVTAYVVTGKTGTTLDKTPVTTVDANTPLLVNAASAGNYDIPVVASGTSYTSTNKMKAGTGAAVSKADGYDRYVLSVHKNGTPSDTSDDYATFKLVNGTAATVAKGKAYLEFATSAGAPEFLGFGGETTGINAVNGSELKVNGEYYNLAGQRVAQPTKGLYIVNGKKVVVK